MVAEYSNKNMNYEKAFTYPVAITPQPIVWHSQYNSQCGRILYDETEKDVFFKIATAPPPKKKGIPSILKIIGGVAAGAAILIFPKDLFKGLKKFFKNFAK